MNKKLLTLAIGVALGTVPMISSASQVKLYGHLQVEVGSIDTGGLAGNENFTADNSRGRIGIEASEKLGNGLTALALFEWRVDTTTGDVDAGDRQGMVGLKGNFGTFEAGALKGAYKYFGGVSYDPFNTTALEARSNGGTSGAELGNTRYGHHAFLDNSIGWKSPNWNGLEVWAHYSIDEQNAAGNTLTSDGDYTVGVRYKNGPFEVGVAAVNNDSITGVLGGDGTKIFGQYKLGNHTFSGQYERIDAEIGALSTQHDVWFFGYQLKAGNNIFVAQVGKNEADLNVGLDTETDYFALGVIHELSKKTRVFGGYRNTDKNAAGAGNETEVFSVGLRVTF